MFSILVKVHSSLNVAEKMYANFSSKKRNIGEVKKLLGLGGILKARPFFVWPNKAKLM